METSLGKFIIENSLSFYFQNGKISKIPTELDETGSAIPRDNHYHSLKMARNWRMENCEFLCLFVTK